MSPILYGGSLWSCTALLACIWGHPSQKVRGSGYTHVTISPSSPVVLSHAQRVEASRVQQQLPQPL